MPNGKIGTMRFASVKPTVSEDSLLFPSPKALGKFVREKHILQFALLKHICFGARALPLAPPGAPPRASRKTPGPQPNSWKKRAAPKKPTKTIGNHTLFNVRT